MDTYKIVKYDSNHFSIWNDFVSVSKNATFLFYRDFMEYHQDRFEDYSLLIYRKNKLVALLPANIKESKIYSHQGLSYGGLILPKDIKLDVVLEIFKTLLTYLHTCEIRNLILKQIPSIYNKIFTEEIQYLMFILRAELFRRDVLSVIDLRKCVNFSKSRLEGLKRGQRHKLKIEETNKFNDFWNNILIPNLENKHNSSPVHSLKEITLLKKYFPNNIRQFNVYHNNKIVAGATIFETESVAHCQYISGNNDNNILGSLDFLHAYLIRQVFKNKEYFDFGTSNKNNGKNINRGLQFWKEGFGARTITQDYYNILTENYKTLNKVMI